MKNKNDAFNILVNSLKENDLKVITVYRLPKINNYFLINAKNDNNIKVFTRLSKNGTAWLESIKGKKSDRKWPRTEDLSQTLIMMPTLNYT